MEVEEIHVDAGEMSKAYSPDILWTDGLGPCIAVAVYDSVTKSGYLMHALPGTSLESQIEEIRKDYDDLTRLRVFVTGNSLSLPLYNGAEEGKHDLSDRLYVEGIIGKYFNKQQTKIRWLPDYHCGELYLCTSTGNFKAESEEEDALLG